MWEAAVKLVEGFAGHPAYLLGAICVLGVIVIAWKLSGSQEFWKWKEAQLSSNTSMTQQTLQLLQEVRQDQLGIRGDIREIRNQSKDALDGVNSLRPIVDQLTCQVAVLEERLGNKTCDASPDCPNRKKIEG